MEGTPEGVQLLIRELDLLIASSTCDTMIDKGKKDYAEKEERRRSM